MNSNTTIDLTAILPYITSVLCAVIAGLASYLASRKQSKADLQRLQKQHELDIKKERELFEMEKEKMNIEHQHQLELKEKDLENQLGTDIVSTMTKEYFRSPAGQAQMRNTTKKKSNKKKK